MKKILAFALVLAGAFLLVPSARAQFTTVTATVTDPNGIPYAAGTMSAVLVPGAPGGFRLSGQPYSGRIGPFTLDSAGKFTANFGDVTLITPSAQWQITINSNQGGIAPPLGTGGQTFVFTSTGTTISGSSPVDISASLNALAPKLTNFSGAGTGTIAGTVTASHIPYASGANTLSDILGSAVTGGTGAIALTAGADTTTPLSINGHSATQSASLLKVFNNGCPLTSVLFVTACGFIANPFGDSNQSGPMELITNASPNGYPLIMTNSGATGNTGSSRAKYAGFQVGTNGTFGFAQLGSGYTGTGGFVFDPNGFMEAGTNEADGAVVEFSTNATGGNLSTDNGGYFCFSPSGSLGSGTACIGTANVAGTPTPINLPTATGSSGQFLQTNGANPQQTIWATPTGTISGLTTGFIPKASSATSLTNSLCDEGITTANTLTCTNSAGAVFSGPIKSGPDGVHSGYSNLVGNTANFAVTANTAGFMGPKTAAFTAYALQLPSTGPTNALPLLSCATPASSVSACTFVAANAAWSAITSGANAQTGAFSTAAPWTFSVTGAASTPAINITGLPFAGTGTTSTPQIYLNGGTAPTNWNVNGTYIGINTASGFNGNVIDYHSNGSNSFFSLSAGSNINMTGSVNANATTTTTSTSSATYLTATNCSSSAAPAVCGSAAAGSVVIAAAATTVTVNTTAVTANSQIFLNADDTLGTKLSVTCNSTLATLIGGLAITARTAGTSFQITSGATPAVNPLCISYHILN